jgi:hypothetical protein
VNIHTGNTKAILLQLALTEKVMLRHMLHHNWPGVSVAAHYCARMDEELRRRHEDAKKAHQHRLCSLCMHDRVLEMLHELDKEKLRPTIVAPAKKKAAAKEKGGPVECEPGPPQRQAHVRAAE